MASDGGGILGTLTQFGKHLVAKSKFSAEDNQYKPEMGTLYELSAIDIDGKTRELKEFNGKVSLVVNVASQ